MTVGAVRTWCWIHKWSSLVSTAFLLLLCITGLPLIFHHEIDELLGNAAEPRDLPAGTPQAPLDRMVKVAAERFPDQVVQYFVRERDEPELATVYLAKSLAPTRDYFSVTFDARTAEILKTTTPDQYGFTRIMLHLHVDLFAGLPGKLFLGSMGLLLIAAIVSGAAIYGRFMRRLDFGTVRARSGRRVRWLDLHNLLGVVTLAWLTVVGLTGVVNTTADLVLRYWRVDQLAEMVAPYRGRQPLDKAGSIDAAVATGLRASPGMTPFFVAFPGTVDASPHHYAIFFRGEAAWSSRLFKPALVDASTAELTDARDMPWYMKALLLSQPLHFGDYGGLPLRIIWALLDVATIIVLASGLYLWLSRRRSPLEERLAEIESGGATEALGPSKAART
jgi:uncharacterized iron-regulated membrane protein